MKILTIGAHFDDIEICCGGTVAKAVKNGHTVKMLVMSHSAYSNFDGQVLRTKEQASEEGARAAKRLGVTDWEVLNFNTKEVPYNSESIEAIDRVITTFKPDLIFTHWVFDTHQDHHNTAQATITASRRQNNILMYESFPPSGRSYFPFRPQIYIDISDCMADKIAAIKEHKTQCDRYGNDWIETITAKARNWGYENSYKYAEVFELVRLDLKL